MVFALLMGLRNPPDLSAGQRRSLLPCRRVRQGCSRSFRWQRAGLAPIASHFRRPTQSIRIYRAIFQGRLTEVNSCVVRCSQRDACLGFVQEVDHSVGGRNAGKTVAQVGNNYALFRSAANAQKLEQLVLLSIQPIRDLQTPASGFRVERDPTIISLPKFKSRNACRTGDLEPYVSAK